MTPQLYTIAGGKIVGVQLQTVKAAAGGKLYLQWREGKRIRRVYIGALKPRRSSWRGL